MEGAFFIKDKETGKIKELRVLYPTDTERAEIEDLTGAALKENEYNGLNIMCPEEKFGQVLANIKKKYKLTDYSIQIWPEGTSVTLLSGYNGAPRINQIVGTMDELRQHLEKGHHDYCILLNFGVRSSKRISLDSKGKFRVNHSIDDTREGMTEKQLMKSNIGKAMQKNSFLVYLKSEEDRI